jgi:hypothetical protein
MAVLRLIGWILLACALVAMGNDILRSVRAGVIDTQPIGALWFAASPGSLIRAQAWVQSFVGHAVWDKGIFPLLTMPAWLPSGFLGVVLLLVTRKRTRRH